MASFTDLIKTGKIKAAFLKRNATLKELSRKALSIDELDKETPNVTTFSRLETNANNSLDELKTINIELDILLESENPDIANDESYIADQKQLRKQEFSVFDTIENYIRLLHSKEIEYPPEVKPVTLPADLSDILNNLVASQNKNITDVVASQSKNLTDVIDAQNKNVSDLSQSLVNQLKTHTALSSKGPKPTQPKFKPKGNDSDFAQFSSFLSQFEFFIVNCRTNVQKLQWLQTSVEGEAIGLIKHFSLVDDNYEIALKKLKDRYSNPDIVKHHLFQSLLSFKCEAGTKFSKTQSAMTALSNTLYELKTVHNLPSGVELCNELLREMCFYNLPYEVRKGLIEETNNNYPQLQK